MGTVFENNDVFENASIMLEVCRKAFENHGHSDSALQLKGLEATSVSTSYASLMALRTIGSCCDETAAVWKFTVRALEATQMIEAPRPLPLVG